MTCESSPSDHVSRELGASNSASNGRVALRRAGKSNSMSTPAESLRKIGPTSPNMEISDLFKTENSNPSISFAEGSPARTFLSPARELGSAESEVVFGPKCSGLFAHYDRASSSWKTYQACFPQSENEAESNQELQLESFSETWPRAGTMRNGIVSRQAPSVPITSVTGFSCWPTPTASEGEFLGVSRSAELTRHGRLKIKSKRSGARGTCRLSDYVRILYDAQPSVEFVRWLMGFPEGWLGTVSTEIASYPKSRKRSAK